MSIRKGYLLRIYMLHSIESKPYIKKMITKKMIKTIAYKNQDGLKIKLHNL